MNYGGAAYLAKGAYSACYNLPSNLDGIAIKSLKLGDDTKSCKIYEKENCGGKDTELKGNEDKVTSNVESIKCFK
jgi:hypothetical protein